MNPLHSNDAPDTEPIITSGDTPTPSEPVIPIASPAPSLTPQPLTPYPAESAHPTPGIIVLQWLTYAFWGWTLLALSALIFIVVFNLIDQADTGNTSLYALAAIVVLLPISLICDFFYQKHEVQKKQGVSMAVMVIHAVIFALFAIGSLIASLFSVVQLLVNSNSTDSTSSHVATLLSFLIIAVLYSITFLRTLNPLKNEIKIGRIFDITMLVVIGIVTVLAFMGPFARSLQTKNDRLIESNIAYVKSGIDDYIKAHNALPATLSDISVQNDAAKSLIDQHLVTYKQEAPDSKTGDYHYELCTSYTLKDTQRSSAYSSYQTDEYLTYITTSGHKAGDVCYKLATANYSPLGASVQLFNQ